MKSIDRKINIMGISFNPYTQGELSASVREALLCNRKIRVVKANGEFLHRAMGDKEFLETMNSADICIADGIGVLWAAKYLSLKIPNTKYQIPKIFTSIWQVIYTLPAIIFHQKYLKNPLPETIPGVQALKIMLRAAEKKSAGVFFFGATQNDLEKSIENLKIEFPKLKISGSLNGYDWQNDKSINPAEIINKSDAKLLIVALGSPLQEYWIRDNIDNLDNVRVAVGEGGSLAFLSGTLKRAPKWINKIGLEWLWRLFMNRSLTHQTGSRLKRVWNAVPVFIFETIKWKIKNA